MLAQSCLTQFRTTWIATKRAVSPCETLNRVLVSRATQQCLQFHVKRKLNLIAAIHVAQNLVKHFFAKTFSHVFDCVKLRSSTLSFTLFWSCVSTDMTMDHVGVAIYLRWRALSPSRSTPNDYWRARATLGAHTAERVLHLYRLKRIVAGCSRLQCAWVDYSPTC